MTNFSTIDIATSIKDVLSTAKTPSVDLETLKAWISWDAKAAGWDGDRKLARALELMCDEVGGRYSLKAEHR